MASATAEGAEGAPPEAEAALDLPTFLADMAAKNRHVSGMALLHREGGEAEAYMEPVLAFADLSAAAAPSRAAVAAANGSFFEGEDAASGLELAGRLLGVAGRVEVGDYLVVCLSEAAAVSSTGSDGCRTEADAGLAASSFMKENSSDGALGIPVKAAKGGDNEGQASAAVATAAGAFLCATRRWVLVVLYDAGMDVELTMKVCVGTADYLASEGQ
eukprot:gnl/TRDRNA2_/TRDRNA2_29614_c0_seq1.p1 gnl/TRDRNA2_/TRDRNA2_29614_c0~~gnl/TRDRNA2_/TRDRNA2_29614_c0_seq1.p1  ORF type:complete len:216 (+),score=55.06 gnl/TRDRNA2_/TRDRNA2_29614_c0_seq1:52-699(+)